MKIALLGSSGMAGHMITRYLEKKGLTIDNYARGSIFKNTKLLNINDIENYVNFSDYTHVINCIGVLVQNSEAYPLEAIQVNASFPHILQEYSLKYGFNLIHLSTDCVFDGNKHPLEQYTKEDNTNAHTFYGKVKALGEVGAPALTIRTSIIGPEILVRKHLGLFEWFRTQKTCFGYSNVLWSGITTLELAKFIEHYITVENKLQGIIQVTNGISISKFDLLSIINETYGLNIKLEKNSGLYSNKSLAKEALEGYEVPSYTKMIRDLYEFN